MIYPSDRVIETAREYLRQRLDAEHSMSYNLEILMREAAERIVNILYAANINPENVSWDNLSPRTQAQINEVVDWLRETIEDYFLTLAIAEHEDNRDMILPYILGVNHGQTFDERLTDYCGKYRDELLLLGGAALFLGVTKMVAIDSIAQNMRHPYKNPKLAEGIAAPLTYGRGRTNSMLTAMDALTRNGVGRGWMYNRHLEALKKEAASFVTFRNSTVPCDICDDYASYTHPIDDPIPPLHNSCVCGTLYFNAFGEPVNLR